jgi:membrane associated rhomboid family serine protease
MASVNPVRLTPWVGRLMVANAGVLVLLTTVLTDPAFRSGLIFDPGAPLAQPWTWVTHLFVHAGPLHLAIALLFLYLFGPAVENRIGGRRFLQLYLGCGLGAAVFGTLLAGFTTLPPVLGASGAVLGVALAYALLWPDAELQVFPIPVPLSAATLLGILVILDLLGAFRFADDGLAHFAHFGGLIVGYSWFRMQGLARSRPATLARPTRRPVMATQLLARQEEHADMVPPPPPTTPEPASSPRERERAELDRLLDKISADGLDSLTPEERMLLREIAARKRDSSER